MSWIKALFTVPPLADPSVASRHEKRILEEEAAAALSKAPTPSPASASSTPSQSTPEQLNRPNRNKVICAGGVAFFAFSLLITRRAFTRRRLASNPAFYTNAPGHHEHQSKNVSAPLEAVEALSIATVNVLSATMMGFGGLLWYLDINSMEEGRRFIRGGLGVDGSGRSEKEAEEDFEDWLASTLARKDAKETQRGKGS